MRRRLPNIEPMKPESPSSVIARSDLGIGLILISLLSQDQKESSKLEANAILFLISPWDELQSSYERYRLYTRYPTAFLNQLAPFIEWPHRDSMAFSIHVDPTVV